MKSTSRFAYAAKTTGTQLMGLAGMPSNKQLEDHVRRNIIGQKSSSNISYIRIIAKDIRKRSNQAASGGSWAKMISDYYASQGLDPYKIAGDLQSRFPSLLPSGIKTEDVNNDSGLQSELKKLEGYLAGTYGSGPGYHGGGSSGGNGSSSGNGSSGSGNGASSGNGGGFSMPNISSGGGNTMWWIIGAGVIGAVILLKK